MNDPVLAQALAVLDTADVAVSDDAGCTDLLGAIRKVRGWVDAVEARVTSRMRELHATTGAAPPADLRTRCGGVSSAEGKRKDRRSEAIEQAPSFGDALADGAIGAEHVDALAHATAELDDDVREALFDLEDELLDDATRMTPERFGRTCRDRARRLERDQGIERNRRQRKQTFLSRRLNPATGMVEGRFAFHPELAEQVFGAVDREVAAMISEGERAGATEFVERTVDRTRLAAEALGRLVATGHDRVRPNVADITYLDHRTATTGRLHDHSICETGAGLPIPPTSIQRALCDGLITPVIVDANGVVLDAGRTIRHANRAQRRALRAMYHTCAIAGCDVSFDRCEIHHLIPWELGGGHRSPVPAPSLFTAPPRRPRARLAARPLPRPDADRHRAKRVDTLREQPGRPTRSAAAPAQAKGGGVMRASEPAPNDPLEESLEQSSVPAHQHALSAYDRRP